MSLSEIGMGPRPRQAVSAFFWRRRNLLGWVLAAPPALWLTIFYLGALLALFVSSLWQVDSMTGEIRPEWTIKNFAVLIEEPVYQKIALRTIGMAVAVTITDCLLALPLAYFITWIAPTRWRSLLTMLVLVPLWSSLLARVYAWRLILAHDGIANWALGAFGLPSSTIGYSLWAVWLVFSYLWLPFVVLPILAALERVPRSLIDASADLGAGGFHTFRRVILPLAIPGLAAGSISSFALTLGDFVTPMLVGRGRDLTSSATRSMRRSASPTTRRSRRRSPPRR